jgi:hypothetical protein
MVSEHVKALSIKTNIVLRITKELQLYREEERMERERVQKMKNDGGDPYDIKFAVCISCAGCQSIHQSP